MFEPLERRASGDGNFSPMEIARHSLFTAREKIELLQKLKAGVTAERANPEALGFEPEEIDAAIEEVKLGAQNSVGAETVLRGAF